MARAKSSEKKAGGSRKTTKTVAKKAAAAKAPRAGKSTQEARPPRERDPRLPAAGTVLVRPYKGKDYRVTVLEDGFRHDGKEYRSLSKLASVITGQASINGFLWMRLTEQKEAEPKPGKSKPKTKVAASPDTAAPEPAPAQEEVARAE